MSKVVSPISRAQSHEFLNKLEAAGLDTQLAQKIIDSKNNELAVEVVDFIRSGGVHDWREENGIIYFSIMSNGMTGQEWISYFISRGNPIMDSIKYFLLSEEFKPTKSVVTEIAVLKGESFEDNQQALENIRKEAIRHRFVPPSLESTCLIRKRFTGEKIKAMGFGGGIVVIHKTGDFQKLLPVVGVDNLYSISTLIDKPDRKWGIKGYGFAFEVPK